MQTTISICGILLLVIAAYGDLRTLRIPNWLVIAVSVLGVLHLIVLGDPGFAARTIAAAAAALIIGFLLFARHYIGGGDAKLIPATALLVGYVSLYNFLLVMALCGALVSIIVLIMQRPWMLSIPSSVSQNVTTLTKSELAVPYGVAIACGGIITLLFQSSLLG